MFIECKRKESFVTLSFTMYKNKGITLMMKYYLAPLEGITGYVYRNTLNRHFPYTDKYFAPFLQPGCNRLFLEKEVRDILPENNKGLNLVPQVLTKNSDDFKEAVVAISKYGYEEINLNFGCPSGTVVSKNKGAGILKDLKQLDQFLDEIFSYKTDMKISVKTRIGYDDTEDFTEILNIYNKYPICELIIHPRLRSDFYNGLPRHEMYEYAVNNTVLALCFNGNVYSVDDAEKICEKFPDTESIMCGRGVISNPSLFREIKGGKHADKKELKEFLEDLRDGYRSAGFDEHAALCKLKEVWNYIEWQFPNNKKEVKRIKKAESYMEYKAAVNQL